MLCPTRCDVEAFPVSHRKSLSNWNRSAGTNIMVEHAPRPMLGAVPIESKHGLCWEEMVDLQPYNTFGIKCIARYLIRIRNTDLEELLQSLRFRDNPHWILGGGSNILLSNQTYDGVVLKNDIGGIEIVSQDSTNVVLRIGGGVEWDFLVKYCIDHDLGGLENLALIPGTVGAAPIQNIGAYGVEISDVLLEVEIVDLVTGQARVMPKEACEFGYRDSIFKHALKDVLVSHISVKLTKSNHHHLNIGYGSIERTLQEQGVSIPSIRSIGEAVCLLRRRKLPDPKVMGNAGSFFKNALCDYLLCQSIQKLHPVVPLFPKMNGMGLIPAAWLIEKCGWKGREFGSVGVSPAHALVLVNLGRAQGQEVLALADSIVRSVQDQFGILLTPEVNIVR